MLIFNWLSLAASPAEYKGILAHAALHNKLCPTSTLTFWKVFNFCPHTNPDLLHIVAEDNPCPSYYRAGIQRVTRRESETRQQYHVTHQGDTQEIPIRGGDWEGFGQITIPIRRSVSM